MSLKEIKRNRVPCHNNTSLLIPAERDFNVRWPVLEDPTAHTVVIESASIDLSQAVLDPAPNYEILIFCDIKAPDTPAGLVFGPNFFRFPGTLSSVEQFTRWLQDILLKKAQPYNLGLFDLSNEDLFRYSISQGEYDASFTSGKFTVSFNEPLAVILNGFVDMSQPESINGQLFYPMLTHAGSTTSGVDTMYRLNKIESVLFTTTLPVTQTEVLDLSLNDVTRMRIVGSVEFNSFSYNIRTKADWIYTPTVFRHYTMNQSNTIDSYSIRIMLQYRSGVFRAHTLAPGERFNVNIAFYPV